ncbi:hypothetical protein BDQ17DRAFT_166349 [Cyathus striatus]|nr:hypothetical protein BDQ17DRAFT_166349 [Cyathus striatus]
MSLYSKQRTHPFEPAGTDCSSTPSASQLAATTSCNEENQFNALEQCDADASTSRIVYLSDSLSEAKNDQEEDPSDTCTDDPSSCSLFPHEAEGEWTPSAYVTPYISDRLRQSAAIKSEHVVVKTFNPNHRGIFKLDSCLRVKPRDEFPLYDYKPEEDHSLRTYRNADSE